MTNCSAYVEFCNCVKKGKLRHLIRSRKLNFKNTFQNKLIPKTLENHLRNNFSHFNVLYSAIATFKNVFYLGGPMWPGS